jgi:hypothetical protein
MKDLIGGSAWPIDSSVMGIDRWWEGHSKIARHISSRPKMPRSRKRKSPCAS